MQKHKHLVMVDGSIIKYPENEVPTVGFKEINEISEKGNVFKKEGYSIIRKGIIIKNNIETSVELITVQDRYIVFSYYI